jgi:predicted alpha/beta-fold hydrolase
MTESAAALHSSDTLSVIDFAPSGWLANAHFQSIVPSLSLRRPLIGKRAQQLLAVADTQIVDCGDGVRLLGHYSSQAAAGKAPAKELVILLHGWEGSADSVYVLSLGSHLFSRGCDIFRLNFRDHGPSHHLNEEIFHSCRLDEVVGAVRTIQRSYPDKRISIAGFSLGGNFALRVAAKSAQVGIELGRAAAVCPVLRPHSTMEVLEKGWWVYHQYFINKWKRSLRLKQKHFPKRHDFREALAQTTIRDMTRVLVQTFGEFSDIDAYLNGYAITGNALAQLKVPSHILISLDDPIIPAHDLQNLASSPNLHVTTIPHGGHCGFMDSFNRESWADRQIAKIMFGPT